MNEMFPELHVRKYHVEIARKHHIRITALSKNGNSIYCDHCIGLKGLGSTMREFVYSNYTRKNVEHPFSSPDNFTLVRFNKD